MMNLQSRSMRAAMRLATMMIRVAAAPFIVGAALAMLVSALPSPSLGQIPRPCHGVPEPGERPSCRAIGQCQGSTQSPCGGDHYGTQFTYCCMEITPTQCDQAGSKCWSELRSFDRAVLWDLTPFAKGNLVRCR